MTLVTAALDRAARRCSVTPPSGWATATRLEHVEIRDDFLDETITELLDTYDMPSPIGKQVVIAGTGAETYSLPSDFRRLAKDQLAVYETTTLRRAGTPVNSDGAWTHLETLGTAGTHRYYRISGRPGAYTIEFEQDLATGRSVTVSYVSNLWVEEPGGTYSETFDDNADVLLFPREIIEQGIVWRFRERKGLDYMAAYGKYEALKERLAIESRGIRSINFGDMRGETKPMRVPVPDYIPDV